MSKEPTINIDDVMDINKVNHKGISGDDELCFINNKFYALKDLEAQFDKPLQTKHIPLIPKPKRKK